MRIALAILAIAAIEPWIRGTIGWAGWLANPLLWLAWPIYFFSYFKIALFLSVTAVVFMTGFLRITSLPLGPKEGIVPIVALGTGYFLWLGSAALLIAAAGISIAKAHLRTTVRVRR